MKNELPYASGAQYLGDGKCVFRLWSPHQENVILHINNKKSVDMKKVEFGYFTAEQENVFPGDRYRFETSDGRYPDPASHYQPEGVHGDSEVVDHDRFIWHDQSWKGMPFGELILYEIHTGTFTDQGTFDAIIPRLDDLKDTGVNAIELMPVAQFPGERNWGYDGVYPYAVQHSYGGPEALKRLVDSCHQKGIAVFLDVVFNHIGPEGNYFTKFGPFFTSRHKMPWGDAINFDGEWSDGVREYFAGNAVYWFDKYHIDGLRLDAVHTIFDDGAVSFWELLNARVQALQSTAGRPLYLVAESDLNSPRVVKPIQEGGYGFTAQWLDDFHHSLYTLLDPEGKKRYEDYGTIEQFAKACRDGFVLSGDWVKFRKRKFGASSSGVRGDRFVVFNQNHDQIGNRVKGERLVVLVDFERTKLAAAAVLLSPYVPMLFMGEEYGEDQPFYFFVDHSDPQLIKAVREGRKKEFNEFKAQGDFPDPKDESTFRSSKLQWEKRRTPHHRILLNWHKALISIRKKYAVFRDYDKGSIDVSVTEDGCCILARRGLTCMFNFAATPLTVTSSFAGDLILCSRDVQWLGSETGESKALPRALSPDEKITLPPATVAVYVKERK